MKIVFVSNYFNHHQKPFCDAIYQIVKDEFCFIETGEISTSRMKLGYGDIKKPTYVKQNYLNSDMTEVCQMLIDNADIVIHGSSPYAILHNRLKNKKITFEYTERVFKKECAYYKLPRYFLINWNKFIKHKNYYLLCASAFTSADYSKTFAFKNKAYKWGYFPELLKYSDIISLIKSKKTSSILWVGRFLDWKHPEVAVSIASRLKNDGYKFELNIIGTGELEENIIKLIVDKKLMDCVHILGAMTPDRVRKYMEISEIFLFTSDRNEGWGAVLNESMNSACAVVASHSIGSVPFLIEDGKNGYVYKNGNIDDLYNKVKFLMDNPEKRLEISRNAYATVEKEWNADNAASRFLYLANSLLKKPKKTFPYTTGVCSKAELISDNWYKGE